MALVTACGGAQVADPQNAQDVAREVEPLTRQSCDGDQEKLVDANGDGRANIRHVFDGGKEVCAEIDMNFDGRADVTRIFDDSGQIAREQHDFDFDGRVDQDALYAGGKLTEKHLDTNFDKLVDTWVWCDGAYITRLERDRHHTGRVDTWEKYQNGMLVAVSYDDNNDGRVERWENYRAGKLDEIILDGDLDGKPDTTEKHKGDPTPLEPVSCDGSRLPEIDRSAAAHAPQPPAATTYDEVAEDVEESEPKGADVSYEPTSAAEKPTHEVAEETAPGADTTGAEEGE